MKRTKWCVPLGGCWKTTDATFLSERAEVFLPNFRERESLQAGDRVSRYMSTMIASACSETPSHTKRPREADIEL